MNDMAPTLDLHFSILMANYNNSKFIADAISSVISQTYDKWELIIVDDCSTDDSIEKIKLFLNDNRIKLIKNKNNLGYGGTLKIAADNAKNPILGILDADDKLHEKALETMRKVYQDNPEYGFIYSTMWNCDKDLRNCRLNTKIGEIIPEKSFIFNPKISHFKTFLLEAYNKTKGFEINQKRSVDKDIIYKLEEVTKFKFVNEPLYYYRHHETGISQGKNKYQARIFHYIAKCKTFRRRLNSELPNFTLRELYSEYFKLTFYQIFRVAKMLYRKFKISYLIDLILRIFPKTPIKLKKRLEYLRER